MHTEKLAFAAPWCPSLVKHAWMQPNPLSYTPASPYCYGFTSRCCKGPSAKPLPWPKPWQPSKFDLFPSPKPLNASREDASPTGFVHHTSIFSCFSLVTFFPQQGCFFPLPTPIPTACVSKGQHPRETLPLPSRPLRYLFILFTSQEDAASCLCQYKIVNNDSTDKEK